MSPFYQGKSPYFRSLTLEQLESLRLLAVGPARVTAVDGEFQLRIEPRFPDGTLGAPQALMGRGMNWQPTSPGTDPVANPNVFQSEFQKWYVGDIDRMARMGVNVVRVFHDFGSYDQAKPILDEFYRRGIYVLVTVDSPRHGVIADLTNIERVVSTYKDHPAVLAWVVGNEWDLNRYYGTFTSVIEAAQFTELAAQRIHALDTQHPVMTVIGDPHIPGIHPLSPEAFPYLPPNPWYTSQIVAAVPSVDVWGLNLYRGASFQDVAAQWRSISDKPVFVTEFGADRFRHTSPTEGVEDEAMQALFNQGLFQEIVLQSSAERVHGTFVGGLVFEFSDEHWKNGHPASQDISTEPNGGQLDGYNDEEIFGNFDINRNAKAAAVVLGSQFLAGSVGPLASTTQLRAISGTSQDSSQPPGLQLHVAGKSVYVRDGGNRGGRGFTVGRLDGATGAVLKEVRTFDTYISAGIGAPHPNFAPLIEHLNSIPAGEVVMLAIGDEGGLINYQSGQPWNEAVIEQTYQLLESFGSTKIRQVKYQGSWSMIFVKGGAVLAEAVADPGQLATSAATVAVAVDTQVGLRGDNRPPILQPIGPRQATQGERLSFPVQAVELDVGQTITYSLGAGAPAGATIHPATGLLSYTPMGNTPSEVEIPVFVTDNGTPPQVDYEVVRVTVSQRFSLVGTTLTMGGTAGDNQVSILMNSPTSFTAILDGAVASFTTSQASTIRFDGQGGNDTVLVVTSPLADQATFTAQNTTIGSPNYTIELTRVRNVFVFGDVLDSADFQDAGGANLAAQFPTHALMLSPQGAFFNEAIGFGRYTATGVGNDDLLFVYGDSGDQSYVATPSQSTMTAGNVTLVGSNFSSVYAYASYTSVAGNDTATYVGGASSEFATSLPAYTFVSSSTHLQFLGGFSQLTVQSGGGTDAAVLFDSVGNDTFTSAPASATFSGAGFRNQVQGYPSVYAFQYFGGTDTATLAGSAGADVLYVNPQYSTLLANGTLQQAMSFSRVTVTSGGGSDTAHFIDSPGNDAWTASSSSVSISGTGFEITAAGFLFAYGYALAGGHDTARFLGAAGNDVFTGFSGYAQLERSGAYLLRAHAFDQVIADLNNGGGSDVATLYDGPGDDTFFASGNQGLLTYAAGNTIQTVAAGTVFARGLNGGVNRRSVTTPLDYALVFQERWI